MVRSSTRHVCLLGPARVDQIQKAYNNAGEEVASAVPRFRSRRTIGLLGYLVTEQRPISRDHLSTLFWPDEDPANGRANLSRELHNLAQILPDCWHLDRQTAAFIPSADTTVDLFQLLNLEKQERWLEAVDLLGGEFLEGIYLSDNPEFDYWLLGERERWRGHAEAILLKVINGQKQRGRYSEALHYVQRLLQFAPWNEQAHRQAMRLLAWTGKRGAALRQFDICKQALSNELNIEPASETIALYQQIFAGKVELPQQLPAFLTEEEARHGFVQTLFIGRESKLAQLEAYLSDALAGRGRIVFITGGPGRGKTALLDAFTRRAMDFHPTLLVAGGRCNAYSGLGDPYLPFRDILTMLTGDVENRWDAGAISREHAQRLWAAFPFVVQVLLDHGPNLVGVLVPEAALLNRSIEVGEDDAPWLLQLKKLISKDRNSREELEQNYLFQQVDDVLRIVAKNKPLLLVLDDVQWGDAASISLLFHLGRHLAEMDTRLLIVCAYRPEEVEMGRLGKRHPLAKPLSEFKRTFSNGWVNLSNIDEDENRRFVSTLLDSETNHLTMGFRDAMFHWTEGHPLFTIELLRAMHERGDLVKDRNGAWIEGPSLDWDVLPARVEAVIKERVDRLSSDLQEILTIASVEGEVFTAKVLALVINVPERRILQQLSQDLERKHKLVKEQEEIEISQSRMSRYRFTHNLFQNYIYSRLSPNQKRLLHGDIAAVIENLYEGQIEGMALQLAQHYYQAGDNEKAYYFYAMAGERAARMYANRESITHYTSAIQLADGVSPDAFSLASLYRERGLAYGTVGEFENARHDHEYALKIAKSAGEDQLEWRTLIDLGRLWASRDYKQALDCFEAALGQARQKDEPAFMASSLNWLGNWYANNENPNMAVKHHLEAMEIFEDLEDRRELANTLDLLGISNLLGGDYSTSVRFYDRAISLSRELEDLPRLSSCLIGRATTVSGMVYLSSVAAAPHPDAMKDFHEALRISREIDLAPDETWAHWSLGLLHIVQGNFGRALYNFQCGLHIASEIGHLEWMVGNRCALGILYCELFTPDLAKEQLEEALTQAEELHSPTWIHIISGALAEAYILLNDLKSAKACLEKVIPPQTPMDTIGKRYCWVRRSEIAMLQDDPELALDIVHRLITTAPGLSPVSVITFLWMLKGEAMELLGKTGKACSLYQLAMENAQVNDERFLLWRIQVSLGRLFTKSGLHVEARKEFIHARKVIDQMASTIDDRALKENFLEGAKIL